MKFRFCYARCDNVLRKAKRSENVLPIALSGYNIPPLAEADEGGHYDDDGGSGGSQGSSQHLAVNVASSSVVGAATSVQGNAPYLKYTASTEDLKQISLHATTRKRRFVAIAKS